MGAESSAQRDGKSQEDASASASGAELSAEVKVLQEEGVLDGKPLQTNGQISSLTSLNGPSEDNTLAEVGQPDGVSVAQKEEAPETGETIEAEVAPQLNGEKVEKDSADANDISVVEEKTPEQKPDEASEVGFKKIFRFVGFKFTLKKDKSEEKDPVKLLTVKDKEGEEVSGTEEKEKEEASTAEEMSTPEEKEPEVEESTAEAEITKDETDATPEGPADGATEEVVKQEGAEKEEESTPPLQEPAVSTFRKLFSGGLFSNLRKKTSIKKTKEEEEKESAAEEEAAKAEETAAVSEKVEEETKEEAPETPKEESVPKEEAAVTAEDEKSESKEETAAAAEEEKSEPKEEAETKAASEPELNVETPAASGVVAETGEEPAKAPAEVTPEGELQSSQEKAKPQGSPLKKLFTGAGLKKLSTKKQKSKKEAEPKLTESGEQGAEQLQSSTDSAEAPKADSGPSSPEDSGEHTVAVEVTQNESSQEAEGEVASDGEKKKEGIIAWSSFKKLVTPKKRVKRPSESEDEATGEKPAKSATLSSTESAAIGDKSAEEETKEEKSTEEEPKTENTEKLVSSTEEPKKKMDTSVSWEALMCMGGPKKRTRRTSDSDDDETEKEAPPAAAAEGEQEDKTEAVVATSQNTEGEEEAATAAEPLSSAPEKESAWDTLKRMVMPKTKGKSEEKPEEGVDQVQSDGEAPKDESSFSLRKLFPGRKKKKAEKQASTEVGSGEEDSDTPAVVPLSEYDDQADAEKAALEEPAAAQSKVAAEERTPSWIPATVEDADEKHDQLSDIPEEAENAATPKSVDTDIADDEAAEQSTPPPKTSAHTQRRLSTAEVKPVAEAPADKTTPVPQGPKSETAENVVEAIDVQISEIPPETSVTLEDTPIEVAAEKTEYEPPTESAESQTNNILEPHVSDEAVAICTGLGTKEIAKVALEKPAMPTIESVTVIRDALSTEVSIEEKPAETENATATEDAVHEAQVNQIEATDLEPRVENSRNDVLCIQVATQSVEPQMENTGLVTTIVEESLYVHAAAVNENSPKAVIFDPITPTSEALVCTQSVVVTEPTVETKEVETDVEKRAATEENAAIEEVVQVVTEEISSAILETTQAPVPKETEPAIPVAVPTEEACVITETVAVDASDALVMEKESAQDKPAQVEETKEAAVTQTAESESRTVVEQASEKTEETQEDVHEASDLQAQGMVIAQAAVQEAVDKVSADTHEDEKPAAPTTTIPTLAQAVATTEEDIKTESPVVTDTPVVSVCEKPAPKTIHALHVAMEVVDAIPIEVTESLREPTEDGEQKPEELKDLKEAVEVKVSEDTVVVEEVAEIKAESEEHKQVEEEQSKKETAEEVKLQAEEDSKEEAPSEGDSEKVLEIHMPVQVVLQTAQVVESPSVEEEAAVEFDSNGPVVEDSSATAQSPVAEKKLPTLSEEPQDAAETEKAAPGKCAEVMAQVMEVIEEAVKEIEPVSTEITAAS